MNELKRVARVRFRILFNYVQIQIQIRFCGRGRLWGRGREGGDCDGTWHASVERWTRHFSLPFLSGSRFGFRLRRQGTMAVVKWMELMGRGLTDGRHRRRRGRLREDGHSIPPLLPLLSLVLFLILLSFLQRLIAWFSTCLSLQTFSTCSNVILLMGRQIPSLASPKLGILSSHSVGGTQNATFFWGGIVIVHVTHDHIWKVVTWTMTIPPKNKVAFWVPPTLW